MTVPDWTAFEMLAEGWEKFTAEVPENDIYGRGLAICAKQLRETIARAKADADD